MPPAPKTVTDAEVARVHAAAYPIDLHLDSASLALFSGSDFETGYGGARRMKLVLWLMRTFSPKGKNKPLFGHVSGKDMRAGGYGGACMTTHALLANLVRFPLIDPWKHWCEHRDFIAELVANNSGAYRLTTSPDEVRAAQVAGQISVINCVEGAHALGHFGVRYKEKRLSRLRELAQAGVAYVTLNHYCNTDLSEAGYKPTNFWRKTPSGGLTAFGGRFIEACIDNGVLVDLSHTSQQGIIDACGRCIARGVPAIASHSASHQVSQGTQTRTSRHLDRTLSNCSLRMIIETGGCISIILAPYYLQHVYDGKGRLKKDADLAFVVRYYEQVADQIACMDLTPDPWRHLSFGSDFDGGIASIPTGMRSGADLPQLTRAMLEAGWPPSRIKAVMSRNFLRIWGQALDARTR